MLSSDLLDLRILSEQDIISHLSSRFSSRQIYTALSETLISLNPNDFSSEHLDKSLYKLPYKPDNPPPPHIYLTASQLLNSLKNDHKNQALIITGEAGSGKTESAKLAMNFLLDSNDCKTSIETKILNCNPIWESFGNARTPSNDNSSRFGKFIRILYDRNEIKVQGAAVSSYLLEKSRVGNRGEDERNFHIFYQFVKYANEEEKKKYLFVEKIDCKEFIYLKNSDSGTMNDLLGWENLNKSFEKMDFSIEEIDTIWTIISSILFLGNLKIDDTKWDVNTACTIKNMDCLEKVAILLEIDKISLMKSFLYRTRVIEKQVIESAIPGKEVISRIEALGRTLYERLFNWLMKKLNSLLIPKSELNENESIQKAMKKLRKSLNDPNCERNNIGILDIFGFENMKKNSFEQFCINFCSEKLLQVYLNSTFKSIEKFLELEGVSYDDKINFNDNISIIELFEKYPLGIFHLLDESTSLNSNDDRHLLEKIIKTHKNSKGFQPPKAVISTFSILHCGRSVVEYNILGFRVKNNDEISKELQETIEASHNDLIGNIFKGFYGFETVKLLDYKKKYKQKESAFKKNEKFLGPKFRIEIKQLTDELETCNVKFVHCIKTNKFNQKFLFDHNLVVNQLKNIGILQIIKMKKSKIGTFWNFFELEKIIGKKYFEKIEKIGIDKNDFLIGKNGIFMGCENRRKIEKFIDFEKKRSQKIIVKKYKKWKNKIFGVLEKNYGKKEEEIMIIEKNDENFVGIIEKISENELLLKENKTNKNIIIEAGIKKQENEVLELIDETNKCEIIENKEIDKGNKGIIIGNEIIKEQELEIIDENIEKYKEFEIINYNNKNDLIKFEIKTQENRQKNINEILGEENYIETLINEENIKEQINELINNETKETMIEPTNQIYENSLLNSDLLIEKNAENQQIPLNTSDLSKEYYPENLPLNPSDLFNNKESHNLPSNEDLLLNLKNQAQKKIVKKYFQWKKQKQYSSNFIPQPILEIKLENPEENQPDLIPNEKSIENKNPLEIYTINQELVLNSNLPLNPSDLSNDKEPNNLPSNEDLLLNIKNQAQKKIVKKYFQWKKQKQNSSNFIPQPIQEIKIENPEDLSNNKEPNNLPSNEDLLLNLKNQAQKKIVKKYFQWKKQKKNYSNFITKPIQEIKIENPEENQSDLIPNEKSVEDKNLLGNYTLNQEFVINSNLPENPSDLSNNKEPNNLNLKNQAQKKIVKKYFQWKKQKQNSSNFIPQPIQEIKIENPEENQSDLIPNEISVENKNPLENYTINQEFVLNSNLPVNPSDLSNNKESNNLPSNEDLLLNIKNQAQKKIVKKYVQWKKQKQNFSNSIPQPIQEIQIENPEENQSDLIPNEKSEENQNPLINYTINPEFVLNSNNSSNNYELHKVSLDPESKNTSIIDPNEKSPHKLSSQTDQGPQNPQSFTVLNQNFESQPILKEEFHFPDSYSNKKIDLHKSSIAKNLDLDFNNSSKNIANSSFSINYFRNSENISLKEEASIDIFLKTTIKNDVEIDLNLITSDLKVEFSDLEPELLKKVISKPFLPFCERYLPRKTHWGKVIPVQSLLTFSKKTIDNPLTPLNKTDEKFAIKAFKLMLKYIYEENDEKKIQLAKELIYMGFEASQEFCNEIFLQFCKQIEGNEDPCVLMKVFELLMIFASFFKVGEVFLEPVLNKIYTNIQTNQTDERIKDIKKLSKLCFMRIKNMSKVKGRRLKPSIEELIDIKHKRKHLIGLILANNWDNIMKIGVESYNTVSEVKKMIIKMLELEQDSTFYGIFRLVNRNGEITEEFVDENELIMDIIRDLEVQREDFMQRVKIGKNKGFNRLWFFDYRIAIKIKIYWKIRDIDWEMKKMLFIQHESDIMNGIWPLKTEDVVNLTGLGLLISYGDEDVNIYESENINKMFPKNFKGNFKLYSDKIIEFLKDFKRPFRIIDLIDNYLDIIKNYELFMSHQFPINYYQIDKNEKEICNKHVKLAIKPMTVLLIEEYNYKTILSYDFSKINDFGVSKNIYFIMKTNDELKHVCESTQCKWIEYLIRRYSELILKKI